MIDLQAQLQLVGQRRHRFHGAAGMMRITGALGIDCHRRLMVAVREKRSECRGPLAALHGQIIAFLRLFAVPDDDHLIRLAVGKGCRQRPYQAQQRKSTEHADLRTQKIADRSGRLSTLTRPGYKT